MNRSLFYRNKPIASLEGLVKALRVDDLSVCRLRHLADTADDYYRVAKEIPKADGSVRTVYDVREPLKSILKAVHARLFGAVIFPDYLSGGIKGRSTRSHARPHVGAGILINEDIASFFPSISIMHVKDVFLRALFFSPEVADVLSRLLTYQGVVPQGAPTSTDIGNLALFRSEPQLKARLREVGFRYNRFVDDMSLSAARRHVHSAQIEGAVSAVFAAAAASGFKLNRDKHSVTKTGGSMITVGHLVNHRCSIPKAYEKSAWKAVMNAEILVDEDPRSERAIKAIRSAKGKVNHLAGLRPERAKRLYRRLSALEYSAALVHGSDPIQKCDA